MTERSRGAPDPAEPPCRDDAPTGSADLSALYGTDALIDALAARAPLSPVSDRRFPSGPDPVLGLLGALIAEVDEGLPSTPGVRPTVETRHGADALSGESGRSGADGVSGRDGDGDVPDQQGSGASRRAPRTIVALGVVGAVLATTGVAAAGGGLTGSPTATSAARIAGEPGASRQMKSDEHGVSSAKPKAPAGRGPGRTPRKRAHEEKLRAGRSGTEASGKRGPSDEERLRKRLDELLHAHPPQRPQAHPDPAEQLRRRLEELRRRVERGIDEQSRDRRRRP
ncbi:hypothetical protein AB0L06_04875 [Spirillospora sp. NPDC052269]